MAIKSISLVIKPNVLDYRQVVNAGFDGMEVPVFTRHKCHGLEEIRRGALVCCYDPGHDIGPWRPKAAAAG